MLDAQASQGSGPLDKNADGDEASWLRNADGALDAARRYVARVRERVAALCEGEGAIDPEALDRHQFEAHGMAWIHAYLAAIEAALAFAHRLAADGRLSGLERLLLDVGLGEYLAQIAHGIALSQDEIVRPEHFGLQAEADAFLRDPSVSALCASASAARLPLVLRLRALGPAAVPLATDGGDELAALIRAQFRAFADERVAPHASRWHAGDELIPLDLIGELANLGVFGLTTPAAYGGSELGAVAMCIVTEELSRGYIGVGSLGTRSEIACELIRLGGTHEQKQHWLPRLADGAILPAAAFTEPGAGSDLARINTRAERDGEVYRLYGAKTWITHAARADLLMLLARTGPPDSGHRGLTMFLAEKARGTEADPFPSPGLSGGEISVLGYRGMKEYELAFDGFAVSAANVLGGVEDQGFRQLMTTFELARIQTAARALGVAQNAFELGFAYVCERAQFGRKLIDFPRVHRKLAWMAAETAMVRLFVAEVARRKDTGARCDVEAGMAKLLAARTAWSAADNALQIHGGNGYALEYPISRVLCDARILNIFEGSAEIQAQIVARGLLRPR